MRRKLPECDELFLKYFDRWYDDGDRRRKVYKATRPDLERAYPLGVASAELSPARGETLKTVSGMVEKMVESARGDCAGYLKVKGRLSLRWVEAFDAYYDRPRILEVIAKSNPEDFSNDYLILCCEFGAMMGHVMKNLCRRLGWIYDWPYWESCLHDPASGYRINVFHWAIKKMSEYGVDDGFAAKINACLRMLDEPPKA